MVNIRLKFLMQTNTINQAYTGGVLWIFIKKNLLLFDSLGLEGFNFFIVYNDRKTIDEVLSSFKKCKVSLTNQKLNLCAMKFSVESWEKMPHNKKYQLTDTAQFFLHLLIQIAKLKRTNDMNILILENAVQDLTSSACGSFQIYFHKKVFDPEEKSIIKNHENLNKTTIETILSEIFSTDVDENEHLIKKFREEYDL